MAVSLQHNDESQSSVGNVDVKNWRRVPLWRETARGARDRLRARIGHRMRGYDKQQSRTSDLRAWLGGRDVDSREIGV